MTAVITETIPTEFILQCHKTRKQPHYTHLRNLCFDCCAKGVVIGGGFKD
jgi:hypothetical protein